MGVAGVMKEVKLSSVPNATLGCLPQWQMMKQDTFPLLLILLPSLSHPQWHLELTKGTGFRSAFAHLPQYTLFAPQTFSIHIVFNFSWDDYNTQEKLKTNMHEPLLQASSSPLPPLRMSRCKIQAQRLSIAGSRLRASELKQRFFVHTQQDVILCPGLMVQPCLHTSLPINNHVTYKCAAGVARGSRSILPLLPPPVLRRTIHLQNRSKLRDKQMDEVRRIVHPQLKPFNFQIIIQKTYYPMDNPSQTYNPWEHQWLCS